MYVCVCVCVCMCVCVVVDSFNIDNDDYGIDRVDDNCRHNNDIHNNINNDNNIDNDYMNDSNDTMSVRTFIQALTQYRLG